MERPEGMSRSSILRRVLVSLGSAVLLLPAGVGAAAEGFVLQAARLDPAPTVDGVVDEAEWSGAATASGFIQLEPDHGQPSPLGTVVRVGYDEEALYVAFRCDDPDPQRLAAAITTRDGEIAADDSVGVGLDPLDDDRTGYYFMTNLLGTQKDGRLADNGRSVDSRWDASWRCAATRVPTGWTVELAIPLGALKYRGGEDRVWGITFLRTVPRRFEVSTWAGPVESEVRVSEFGELTGLKLPLREDKRWELIPYVLGTAEEDGDSDTEVGGTLRFRASSRLFAELTINPDFALVEADVEEINLSRFELFIAEKRPFFLEGNERFSQRIRQFYSRRIGEIPWGLKGSGTFGGTDFIVLSARSDLQEDTVVGSETDADYTVVRLQQGIFGGSNVGLLAANRRIAGEDTGSVGVDTTLFFTDTLGMTAQFLRVHGGEADGGLAWFVRPAYDSSTTHFHVRYTHLDEGIRDSFNTVGFLRDDNRKEFDTNFTHTFWFEDTPFEKVRADVNYNRYRGQDGQLRSYELEAEVSVSLTSRWFAELEYVDEFKRFEKDFWNRVTTIGVGYDTRAGRSLEIEAGDGTNFDSDLRLVSLEAKANLSDRWNLSYEATRLELDPDPAGRTTWIHVLRSDYYFTSDLFVKLFLQTNSAIDKDNVQALFVWRFKPPFGSLQVAYQRGTSDLGTESDQGNTLFSKLSWVF
ncbi:MAG: carbohydrate binding family 9 domain-containing protein [bacterium]|nr:carbohydrate binding family 9 domain-containing protein [bacterium]